MGLFNKLKNILFEEEYVEVPTFTEETGKKEEVQVKETTKEVTPVKEDTIKEIKIPPKETVKESTFEFPVFNEEEFTTKKEVKPPKPLNSSYSKSSSYTKYTETLSKPSKPKEEKKIFKPSPMVSPVYGIIGGDAKKIIGSKAESPSLEITKRVLSVEDIRKKAYGTLEDDIEIGLPSKEETKETKVNKSIDELLFETIDERVDFFSEEKETPKTRSEKTKKILNELETIDKDLESSKTTDALENDTTEADLFNLIDSMYEKERNED